MFNRRLLALLTSTGLCVGGGTAAVLVTSHNVGATGPSVSHSLTAVVKKSLAVEGTANVTFTCDDVTGAYSIKVTNVQVIEDDHVTRWPVLSVTWTLGGMPHFASGDRGIRQNTKNGLFGVKSSGVLSDIGACFTGANIDIADGSIMAGSHSWLWLSGTLT